MAIFSRIAYASSIWIHMTEPQRMVGMENVVNLWSLITVCILTAVSFIGLGMSPYMDHDILTDVSFIGLGMRPYMDHLFSLLCRL